MTDVIVRLDDSIRLVSAVLAATDFPEKVQAKKPHGTHLHSRATSRYLKAYREHEAVKGMQALLDSGASLEAIYTLVSHLPWPGLQIANLPRWVPENWSQHLADFYQTANLTDWWEQEKTVWDAALTQSQTMFKDVEFKTFLSQFVGDIPEDLVFMPNICFPGDRELGLQIGQKELIALCPPRLAWGDSPPWPFDEDQSYIHRVALHQYTRMILMSYIRQNQELVADVAKTELPVDDKFKSLYPTWGEQFVTIFQAAVIAIYLENLSKLEARAFIQDRVRIHHIKVLPGAVSVFKRYLQERENGKFETLVDFLPVFNKQLKVAKRIISI